MLLPMTGLAWTERVFRVIEHVQTHLDEDISPSAMADVAGLSLHHFHRVFRGMTGESLMGFVRRLRLERAALRLRYGSDAVLAIALGAGYGSHEAFTRAFHSRFGVPPSAYREQRAPALKDVPIVLREEPPREVIAMRHVGPYEGCMSVWERLLNWGKENDLPGVARPGLGLAYDDPTVTDADKIRYDACLPVGPGEWPADRPLPPGFTRRTVSGGTYAVAMHHGRYDDIEDTYVALIGNWLPRRRVELVDEPIVEVYLRAWNDAPPEQFLTEVTVRVTDPSEH